MMNTAKNRVAAVLGALALAGAARAATVTVGWDANTEPDLAGYRLYYATYSLTGMATAQAMGLASVTKRTSPGLGTSLVVNNLAEDTTYYFRLTAYDVSTEESLFSTAPPEISTYIKPTPPSTPTGMTATPATPVRIDLSWAYGPGDPAGFTVEWSLNNGGSWTQIATLPGTSRTYQSTVQTSVPYRYRVKATKPGMPDSGYSTSANVATSPNTTPPVVPPTTPNGGGSAIPVTQRFLSPGKEDTVNDVADFGADAGEVEVLDVRGRLVFHGQAATGSIQWRGKGEGGEVLHSGVYIAKVKKRDGTVRYEKILIAK